MSPGLSQSPCSVKSQFQGPSCLWIDRAAFSMSFVGFFTVYHKTFSPSHRPCVHSLWWPGSILPDKISRVDFSGASVELGLVFNFIGFNVAFSTILILAVVVVVVLA